MGYNDIYVCIYIINTTVFNYIWSEAWMRNNFKYSYLDVINYPCYKISFGSRNLRQ